MASGAGRRDRWLEALFLVALAMHVVLPRYAFGADIALAAAMLAAGWLSPLFSAMALGAALASAWEPRAASLFVVASSLALVRARTWLWLLWPLTIAAVVPQTAHCAFPFWLFFAAEAVFRRARPVDAHGRLATWRHPSALGWPLSLVANSRVLQVLLEPLPEATMRSDITNVVYVNYLVAAAVAEKLVPTHLELQRLGPNGEYALFSFLTYQHGHFGFAFLGPLRRFLPSPIQTNWRIHVFDPRTKHQGIYFLTNAITHTLPALAARMTTEGMPMHVFANASLERGEDTLNLTLEPGRGSAPDARLSLRQTSVPALAGPWAACWKDFRAFLAYCVPQDRAMSSQPLRHRVSRQEIDLGIPLDACIPFEGVVDSRAAKAIVGDAAPLCFVVPSVRFEFSVEAHDAVEGANQ